jgi:hypothetical protein
VQVPAVRVVVGSHEGRILEVERAAEGVVEHSRGSDQRPHAEGDADAGSRYVDGLRSSGNGDRAVVRTDGYAEDAEQDGSSEQPPILYQQLHLQSVADRLRSAALAESVGEADLMDEAVGGGVDGGLDGEGLVIGGAVGSAAALAHRSPQLRNPNIAGGTLLDALLVEGKVRAVEAGEAAAVLVGSVRTQHEAAAIVEIVEDVPHFLALLAVVGGILAGGAPRVALLAGVRRAYPDIPLGTARAASGARGVLKQDGSGGVAAGVAVGGQRAKTGEADCVAGEACIVGGTALGVCSVGAAWTARSVLKEDSRSV